MDDGFDGVYVDTRRQLRGVAESLIAGPQYRASGTIRLTQARPTVSTTSSTRCPPMPFSASMQPRPSGSTAATTQAVTQSRMSCQRSGPFWNAPFGASYPLNPAHDVDELTSHIADFFERGRREVSKP
jgi:hypothetical protein